MTSGKSADRNRIALSQDFVAFVGHIHWPSSGASMELSWLHWLSSWPPDTCDYSQSLSIRDQCTKVRRGQNAMTRRSELIKIPFPDVASIAGSRKSMNLQPVLLVSPHHAHHAHHMGMGSAGSGHLGPMHHGGDDTISQFSSRTAANNRYNRPEYHNSSMHQFQL